MSGVAPAASVSDAPAPTGIVYLDTSALVKLVVQEPESEALAHELQGWPDGASSSLAWIEFPRAVRRARGDDEAPLFELWGMLAAVAELCRRRDYAEIVAERSGWSGLRRASRLAGGRGVGIVAAHGEVASGDFTDATVAPWDVLQAQ